MASELLKECVNLVERRVGADLDAITIERATFGLFFSGVKLSSGHGGLCFTPVKEMPQAVCCPSSARAMPMAGKLAGRTAREYLDDVFDPNPLKRTLGIATMNALSSYVWDREGAPGPELGDAFDALELTPQTNAVVVGALAPMFKRLRAVGCPWHVLEMDPRTLKGDEFDHYVPADRAAAVVPDADLLVITGVTILNDSLEGLLQLAKPNAQILVTGPTVSMLPNALFERGVTMVGGLTVTDADKALDLLAQAGSGYHLFGTCAERTIIRA